MNRSRDLALAAVAIVAVIALAVVASIQPPAADGLTTGIVALGVGALGRISGANGQPARPEPPGEGGAP